MTPEQAYDAWAPPGATWSTWVKPVLFSYIERAQEPVVEVASVSPAIDIERMLASIPRDDSLAVVIDLAGVDSVRLGLRLAQERGSQVVPLFNAVPATFRPAAGSNVLLPPMAINVWPIIDALAVGVSEISARPPVRASAPPVFLLDGRRRGEADIKLKLGPGGFDNRSISLPTDFPSANFLLSSGIQNALVVQESGDLPRSDLAHTLRRWQEAGLPITLLMDGPTPARPITVRRPPWFRWAWHNFLVRAGYRRNPLGGFGGYLAEASAGGGGGGG